MWLHTNRHKTTPGCWSQHCWGSCGEDDNHYRRAGVSSWVTYQSPAIVSKNFCRWKLAGRSISQLYSLYSPSPKVVSASQNITEATYQRLDYPIHPRALNEVPNLILIFYAGAGEMYTLMVRVLALHDLSYSTKLIFLVVLVRFYRSTEHKPEGPE